MKKFYFAAVAFAALTLTSCGNTEAETETTEGTEIAVVEDVTFNVDSEATTLEWRGSKMVAGVEDHAHKGTVNVSEGMIVKKGEDFVKGEFTIDLTDMTVTDYRIGEEDKEADSSSVQMLLQHLSEDKFFKTSEFSKAKVKVNSMTADMMNVTINVLGKEITQDIDVTSSMDGDKMVSEGKFTVDMVGVAPALQTEGEEYVSSNIEFDLKLVTKK